MQEFPSPTVSPALVQHISTTWPKPKSMVEKEYKVLYLAEGQQLPYINTLVRNDLYFHLHLSGVMVLGLAPTHPIIVDDLTITDVKWKKLGTTGQLQLSGKRKHGAVQFHPDDLLCIIECHGGIEYHIKPYVRGKLIDTNLLLTSQPRPERPKPDHQQNGGAGNRGKGKNGRGKQNQPQSAGEATKPQDSANLLTDQTQTSMTPAAASTTAPAQQPIIQPAPVPIADLKLLEQYKILKTDPLHDGYLCLLLLSPEQMQLMLRLFLSQRDFNEFQKRKNDFLAQIKPYLCQFSIPHLVKSVDYPKPTLSTAFMGNRYIVGFKKGEFKQRHGVYHNMFSNLVLTTKSDGLTIQWKSFLAQLPQNQTMNDDDDDDDDSKTQVEQTSESTAQQSSEII